MSGFTGFPTDAWQFLDELASDNDTNFFNAHRERYRQAIAEPSAAFVDTVAPALQASVHAGLRGDPRVGRSLFRINRDTRFGHDKTPYKTHLDFLLWIGDGEPRRSTACIIRLTSTTVLLGAGRIGLTGDQLADHRQRVAGDTGPALRTIVDRLLAADSQLSDADRARVPAGLPTNHPNADLLRRDGFHLTHTSTHPDCVGNERFIPWVANELSRYGPLLEWLAPSGSNEP